MSYTDRVQQSLFTRFLRNCPEITSRFPRSESRQDFRNRGVPKLLTSFATTTVAGQFLCRDSVPTSGVSVKERGVGSSLNLRGKAGCFSTRVSPVDIGVRRHHFGVDVAIRWKLLRRWELCEFLSNCVSSSHRGGITRPPSIKNVKPLLTTMFDVRKETLTLRHACCFMSQTVQHIDAM